MLFSAVGYRTPEKNVQDASLKGIVFVVFLCKGKRIIFQWKILQRVIENSWKLMHKLKVTK